MLGAYIDGIAVDNEAFVGNAYGFLTGFSVITGLGVIAGYALLGATWLVLKTAGTTQAFARKAALPSLVLSLVFLLAISIWTPLDHELVVQRWFSAPQIYYLWIPPALTVVTAYGIWRALEGRREALPFLLSIVLFLLALLGLGITLWPYAVPYSVTLWQAASSTSTQEFLGVGTVIILPIILLYLAYAHWIFRGKARTSSDYGP